jgi:hypothetical protein
LSLLREGKAFVHSFSKSLFEVLSLLAGLQTRHIKGNHLGWADFRDAPGLAVVFNATCSAFPVLGDSEIGALKGTEGGICIVLHTCEYVIEARGDLLAVLHLLKTCKHLFTVDIHSGGSCNKGED